MVPDVEDVSAALTALAVPHAHLSLTQASNNFSFSDGKDVFVKISRPGVDAEQLHAEVFLAHHYGTDLMLKPILPDVVPFHDSFMSVWNYEHLTSFKPKTVEPSIAASLAGQLNQIHHLPSPPMTMRDMRSFDYLKAVIADRVEFGLAHGLEARYAQLMLLLTDTFLTDVPEDSIFVLNHGDAHVGNAAFRARTGKPTWLDYESVRLAPPEFDAATLKINLQFLGQNPDAWNAAEQVFNEEGLKPELMELFTVSRLISITSYAMLFPENYGFVRVRLDIMDEFLHTGVLPTWFPDERS